jgi:hypothetical protein
MNKYLLIIGIFATSIFSQTDDIPYDWSGQYGVITNNGRLMWNQDWTLGTLFIDGTFSNYPTRFGSSYKNNFEILNTGDFFDGIHCFPDSSQIKSKIDYYRGDFSYDQLEIDAEFAKKNRIISLNGFKRTYDGPYGQYTDPQGGSTPLQQSYRLDYSSKDKDENLDISIGHFITDSRLNLNDPADFTHKEKIISAGIGYSKNFTNWQYNFHGSLFQQYYKMSLDSIEAYLNRVYLNQFVSKKLNKLSSLQFGLVFDNQVLSLVDTTKKDRYWSTLYGGWEKQSIGIKLGTTITQNDVFPFIDISANSKENKFIKWKSHLKYEAIPKHIFLLDAPDESDFEELFSAHADAQIIWNYIPINLNFDYYNNQKTSLVHKYYINDELIDISDNMFSTAISTQIPIFREWKIDTQYRHTWEHNYYSDGIGDRAQIGLTISENIFKNNLFAKMRLWGDAYLNHHQSLGYEGFDFGPYLTDDTNLALPDYWVFNLELSAKISSMTILWRVNNILQTTKSLTDQLLPNIDGNYLLITNSNNFPPMNRFVTLNIIWDFEN